MNMKRMVTALVGFPIVACALIFGNKYENVFNTNINAEKEGNIKKAVSGQNVY